MDEQAVVVELTAEEYRAARDRALARIGLTWQELKDQADRHDFDSATAAMVWSCIGD